MKRTVRRGFVMGGVVGMLVALALALFAGTASAAPIDVTVQVNAPLGPPLSDADQLVSGVVGNVLSLVTGTLCQVVSGLLGGGVLGPAATLTCELQLINLDLHTIYKNPTGQLVTRDQTLIPAVPTPVDMTGDGIPDALALVSINSVNAVSLQIIKLPTAPAVMPLQAELIIRDPGNPNSNERISAGYNALSSTAPQSFKATLSLLGISPLQLGLNVAVTQPGSDLALIGSLFSQSPDGTRQVSTQVSLDYSPVPAALGYQLLLAGQHQHVTATASSPSLVNASVVLNNGNDTQTIVGAINQIPAKVDLDLINEGPNQKQATYAGSAPINTVDVVYQDVSQTAGSSHLNTQIVGHVVSLPTGVMFEQSGPRVFSFATSGGSIGSVDGGFANGEPVIDVPGTGSGAYIKAGGGLLSGAARITGLSAATVDMSDPYLVDVTSATQPLSITDIDGDAGRTVTGNVTNLPAHITLKLDPDHGMISEDGHGQGITQVTANVTAANPFAGRIARLRATLSSIPSSFNLNYTYAGGGAFSGTLDHPIGRIQLTADDGHNNATVQGPDSGVNVIDTPSKFAIAATVYGLQSLSFNPSPFDVALTTAGGHIWNVDADILTPTISHELTASGVIDQMPPTAEVKVFPDSNGTSMDAVLTEPVGSPTINHVGVDIHQPGNPFFKTVTHAHADLYSVTGGFKMNVDDTGASASLSLDNPIGEVDVAVDDGVNTVTVQGTDAGLNLLDSGGTFAAAARVFGLRKVSFVKSPLDVSFVVAPGYVFNLNAKVDVATTNSVITTTSTGLIDKMPASAEVKLTPGSTSSSGDLIYNEAGGSSSVDHIALDTYTTPALFKNANHVKVDLVGIPSSFDVHFVNQNGTTAGTITNPDPHGTPPNIGTVAISLDDGVHTASVPGTDAGLGLIDSGGIFAIAAKIFGLQSFSYQATPLDASFQVAPGHVFNLTAKVDVPTATGAFTATATGLIDQMPASAEVKLLPGATSGTGDVIYNGSPVNHIGLEATMSQPLIDDANHVKVDLLAIPGSFDLNYSDQSGSVAAALSDPSGGPAPAIGTAVAYLDNGTDAQTVPTGTTTANNAGLALLDSGGHFAIAARVYGLTSISFQSSPMQVAVSSAGAPEFDATAKVDIPGTDSMGNPLTIPTTFNGELDSLPSNVSVNILNTSLLGTGYTSVNYDGHGQTINHLSVDAMSTQPLFTTDSAGTGPTHLHADLFGIPTSFNLFVISPAAGGVQAGINHPVHEIQANLDNGTTPTGIGFMFPSGQDALSVTDTTATEVPGGGPNFQVDAQIYGLSAITFNASPITLSVQADPGHFLAANGEVGSYANPGNYGFTAPLIFNAHVNQLPSSLSMTQTTSVSGSAFHYHASSQIDKITVTLHTPWEGSTAGPIVPGFGNFVYGEIENLPAFPDTGPSFDITVPTNGGKSGPFFIADTHDHPIGHVLLEVLENQNYPTLPQLVEFPDPKSMVNGFVLNPPGASLENDGIIYQCCSQVILAVSIHGLINASVAIHPYFSTSFDVDPTFSQTLGLGITSPGSFGNNGPIINGFIDKPAPNTSFSTTNDNNGNPLIQYDAAAPVKEVALHVFNAGPEQNLDLKNIPTKLTGCIGTGFGADSCVLRDGPTPIAEDTSNPTGEHTFAIYFTDFGTSLDPATCELDSTRACLPITVNEYMPLSCSQPGACIEPSFDTLPPASWDPHQPPNGEFVKINNLQFHTLLVDAFFTTCSGLEICAKFSIDTHGQETTGNAYYSNPNLASGTWAGMGLPPGFSANYREIWFNNDSITGNRVIIDDSRLDGSAGHATCPIPDTFFGGIARPIGVDVLDMTPAVCG